MRTKYSAKMVTKPTTRAILEQQEIEHHHFINRNCNAIHKPNNGHKKCNCNCNLLHLPQRPLTTCLDVVDKRPNRQVKQQRRQFYSSSTNLNMSNNNNSGSSSCCCCCCCYPTSTSDVRTSSDLKKNPRDNQQTEKKLAAAAVSSSSSSSQKWTLQDLKIMKPKRKQQQKQQNLVKPSSCSSSGPDSCKAAHLKGAQDAENHSSAPNCAKCQLIVSWTSAQAHLTRLKHEHEQQQCCEANNKLLKQENTPSKLNFDTKNHQQMSKSQRTQEQLSEGFLLAPFGCGDSQNHNNHHHHQTRRRLDSNQRCRQYSRANNNSNNFVQRAYNKQQRSKRIEADTCSLKKSSSQVHIDNENQDEDVSSLSSPTSSLLAYDNDNDLVDDDDDRWSLSSAASCCEIPMGVVGAGQKSSQVQRIVSGNKQQQQQQTNQTHRHHQIARSQSGVCQLKTRNKLTATNSNLYHLQQEATQYRRPAPAPPKGACCARRDSKLERCDNSLDSGNTSGVDTSRHSGAEDTISLRQQQHQQQLLEQEKKISCKPTGFDISNKQTERVSTEDQQQQQPDMMKPNLLTENEVFSIEHFLKSHKSSIYVCGCMANLYLTNTELVNNGRCSKPTPEGWQLSQTGVPVLTFDSGLTRNRDKRRLCINLAERGSGFVLWSDIIDHLSNYRAYSAQLHTPSSSSSSPSTISSASDRSDTPSSSAITSLSSSSSSSNSPGPSANSTSNQENCDTFHVMYLSTNHRIMVGLSFDDATCAKLFLRQIELVTSDPVNISLTGPKLARRLASVGRFGRLLANNKRTKSIGSLSANYEIDAQIISKLTLKGPSKHIWASSSCLNQDFNYIGGETFPKPKQLAKNSAEKHATKLTKLVQGSKTKRAVSMDASPHIESSSGVDYSTWSTLKRAIKIGHQPQKLSDTQNNYLNSSRQNVCASFKPKPLVSLAISGKIFRAGKRMPRKCDISAPCLFQHVTRVDLTNLEKLYSNSLVNQNNVLNENSTNDKSPGSVEKLNNELMMTKEYQAVLSEQQQHQKPTVIQSNHILHNGISNIEGTKGTNCCQTITSAGSTSAFPMSSTSTSSCYSSAASISPPSSECGATPSSSASASTAAASSVPHQPRYGHRLPRPLPPKVPQRTSSYESSPTANMIGRSPPQLNSVHGNGQVELNEEDTGTARERVVAPTTAATKQVVSSSAIQQGNQQQGLNKIQAIIRELQSQTSAELVDAKRKLMADIADQVVARASQQQQQQQQQKQQQQQRIAKLNRRPQRERYKQHSRQASEDMNAVSRL